MGEAELNLMVRVEQLFSVLQCIAESDLIGVFKIGAGGEAAAEAGDYQPAFIFE